MWGMKIIKHPTAGAVLKNDLLQPDMKLSAFILTIFYTKQYPV